MSPPAEPARPGIALGTIAASFDIRGPATAAIQDVTEDSREVRPGSLFVAVPGTAYTKQGDLIVLIGAHGMNAGRDELFKAIGHRP